MDNRNRVATVLAVVAVVLVVIGLWASVKTVEAGHVGVVTTFGRVEPETLSEGLHLIAPWRKVIPLSNRTQELKETADSPTMEGLLANIEVSLLFSLKKESAADVYQRIGPNYIETVVVPQLRSALRNATAKYKSEDLYSASRGELEKNLEVELTRMLDERGVRSERVLLRRISLPDAVKTAIDQKVAAEQKRQQMQIELQQAETEAKKKLVEAQGTKDAQKLIQETLSENYIRYLWVKALETAATNRTAMIYVPTGPHGMPLVEVPSRPNTASGAGAAGER
jgi:regulator of protease activity HflC (stomatin/prohibitin superfamily)